jgi:hypothetical protein
MTSSTDLRALLFTVSSLALHTLPLHPSLTTWNISSVHRRSTYSNRASSIRTRLKHLNIYSWAEPEMCLEVVYAPNQD